MDDGCELLGLGGGEDHIAGLELAIAIDIAATSLMMLEQQSSRVVFTDSHDIEACRRLPYMNGPPNAIPIRSAPKRAANEAQGLGGGVVEHQLYVGMHTPMARTTDRRTVIPSDVDKSKHPLLTVFSEISCSPRHPVTHITHHRP